MHKKSFKNILMQSMKPLRFYVMLKKVFKRIIYKKDTLSKSDNLKWLSSNLSDFEKIACSLNPIIWEEAKEISVNIEKTASDILKDIECNLGGGGCYPFLYFLARYMKPENIVETGVAAGFSSYSFLSAINANGKGMLYSSDFPYFRIKNPEKYIGIIVPSELKGKWVLYIDGDEINLPKIIKQVNKIDIFHYDSDKSYSGRKFAISLISKNLSEKGLIVIDDIQDNSFFYDYIQKYKPKSWYVFKFQDKYFGMIGNL